MARRNEKNFFFKEVEELGEREKKKSEAQGWGQF